MRRRLHRREGPEPFRAQHVRDEHLPGAHLPVSGRALHRGERRARHAAGRRRHRRALQGAGQRDVRGGDVPQGVGGEAPPDGGGGGHLQQHVLRLPRGARRGQARRRRRHRAVRAAGLLHVPRRRTAGRHRVSACGNGRANARRPPGRPVVGGLRGRLARQAVVGALRRQDARQPRLRRHARARQHLPVALRRDSRAHGARGRAPGLPRCAPGARAG